MEKILLEYQAKITALTQKYLNTFLQEVPKEKRSIDTAGEFLQKYYQDYRKEVAGIGVDLMHEKGLGADAVKVVLQYNSWAISKLYVEVMNETAGHKVFGTQI